MFVLTQIVDALQFPFQNSLTRVPSLKNAHPRVPGLTSQIELTGFGVRPNARNGLAADHWEWLVAKVCSDKRLAP